RRHAKLELADRQLGIAHPEHAEAAARLRPRAGMEIGRAHRAMHPEGRWTLAQPPLLPDRSLGIGAREEMRASDTDVAVEGERVMRREVERDVEALYRRFRIAAIDVDPAAAAPGPGRAAVHRERLGDHLR